MGQGCALALSGFRIYCTCSGTRNYQSTSAHSLGWRGARGVSFVFLAPESPDQTDPGGRKGVGSARVRMLQERGQHDEGPLGCRFTGLS